MNKNRLAQIAAGIAAAGLALSGCSASGSGEGGAITLGVFNGWDEGIATSELWKAVLENQGYDVKLSYLDAAPLFAGIAEGDLDFTTDVWLPTTHANYLEEFGSDMEDLGVWFDSAKLTLVVNEDAPITSITELADNAELFGNQIIGIEPGAGLTQAMEDSVIPGYGLEGMKFTTSSTTAMLTELQAATDAGENIVATLWEPHWAYSAFPIRNLDDPQGTLGDAEAIHIYSRTGFSDDQAEVAGWLGDFQMAPELLYDLEDLLFNQNDTDDYGPLVRQWIEDNQDFVDAMTA